MYQLNHFVKLDLAVENGGTSSLIKLIKSKWVESYSVPNVFRFIINNSQEKLIDGKYLLLLNPDRNTKRRTPEYIDDIRQPFDELKFNFTKIIPEEILFSIEYNGDEHTLIVNASPISHYHTLLCPSVNKKLPQVVTKESLLLALEIMYLAQDRNLKIAFNSLCAFASVNHLHYHLLFVKHPLPVELVKWKNIKGPIHCTEDYVIKAFCFEVPNKSVHKCAEEIFKLITYLLDNNIAHNILITMRNGIAAVYVFPRKSTAGVKQLKAFNVAAFELSGWIIAHSAEAFQTLKAGDIETELKKWEIDDFDQLCRKVTLLY